MLQAVEDDGRSLTAPGILIGIRLLWRAARIHDGIGPARVLLGWMLVGWVITRSVHQSPNARRHFS